MTDLDHVAHFVPEVDAASAALERIGFTLTPFSPQSHRLEPQGPLVPAGTGNRCVMFEAGFVELLTPTHDTPIANQLRTAMQRYVGVHLIAFGSDDAGGDYARLQHEGFKPGDPVALQRPIGTPEGAGTARFTVVRVPPGTMAEGRIQFCQHHTRELLWQPRWLSHRNGAIALTGAFVCVADPHEAAERYTRFTGVAVTKGDTAHELRTARGTVYFMDEAQLEQTFGVTAPAMPWIAGYSVATRDAAAARGCLENAGCAISTLSAQRTSAALPPALGGLIVFEPAG